MKDIINRIAELRKNIETAKTTDVIEISVELIRIESLLKQLTLTDVSQQRELLVDFLKEQEYCGLVEILEDNFEHYVDEYLKDK